MVCQSLQVGILPVQRMVNDMAMKDREPYAAEMDEPASCGYCKEPIEPFSPTVDVCEGTLSSRGFVVFPDAVTSYHRLCYQSRVGEYKMPGEINGGPERYSGHQRIKSKR
jgi:hypothetical protein